MKENDEPINECGFCGNNMRTNNLEDSERNVIINDYDDMEFTAVRSRNGRNLLQNNSRFSNIEELDAEHDTESERSHKSPSDKTLQKQP